MNKYRIQLIESIERYAGDELDVNDWIEIAKEDITELIERLNSITEYYYSK